MAPPPAPTSSIGGALRAGAPAALSILRVSSVGVPALDTWIPRPAEVLDYLARVRDVLAAAASETRKVKQLATRHATLFRTLVLATAWQESCWRQSVRRGGKIQPLTSSVGAVGIMQVHQHVWRGFYEPASLRSSLKYNARAGSEILHHYLVDYAISKGEQEVRGKPDDLASASYSAYNAGPRQLRRYRRPFGKAIGHKIDRSFAEKYRHIQAGDDLAVAACFPGFTGST